jgi:hypothetical protein
MLIREPRMSNVIEEPFDSEIYSEKAYKLYDPCLHIFVNDEVVGKCGSAFEVLSFGSGRTALCINSNKAKVILPLANFQSVAKRGSWHELSGGRPIIQLAMALFSDETSGNKSKKWNHFDNLFLQLLSFPKNIQHIHFLGTVKSKKWDALCQPILEECAILEKGLVVFDRWIGQEVFVIAKIMTVIADNPRAAQICSIVNSSGNFPCRVCTVQKGRFLSRGSKRTIAAIRTLRAQSVHLKTGQILALTRQTGATFGPNPFLDKQLSLDVYSDIPIEVLHTVLLGKILLFGNGNDFFLCHAIQI